MRWRRRAVADAIWRGSYARFSDVPVSGGGHASEEWLAMLTRDVEIARSGELPDDFVAEHELLLLLLRTTSAARVVDFGGGAGASYAYVRRVAPEIDVTWEVIELDPVVAHGRVLFGNDPSISFDPAERQAPRLSTGPPSIVFIKSALQYIDDWSAALRGLFALGARYLILEKFSGVSSPTYATAQLNLGASVVPYWFISFDDVFAIAARAGYRRVLWRRLPRWYDQSEFPAAQRMGQASSIVFAKV